MKSDRDDKKDRDRDRKQHKVKMVTAEPDVLLAFSYFDLSHVGYLMDKDTEDILHTIGLHLSRSQVRHCFYHGTYLIIFTLLVAHGN